MINILLLLSVIFWGLSFIGTKMALEYLTPSEIISVRFLLGLSVLLFVKKVRKAKFNFKRSDLLIIISVSLLFGFHVTLQAFGLIHTSATNTAWLIATVPVFIAIGSRIVLKENLNKRKIIGILIATLGVMLLISKGHLDNLNWLQSVGDWIILFTCVTWTVYTIIIKKLTKSYNPLSVMVAILLIPAICLIIYTLITTPISKFVTLPNHIVFILMGLGVICAGLAQWVWLEGVNRKGAIKAGVYIYFEPVVTTLAAIPILGERLNVAGFIGAGLILTGVYLVERNNNKKII
ncbi:MAG: DMT family transporter [candidate division Zixibacteria bacterium]|nr:DMT family transporter [candidate division Zixibacteria bacterium]